LTTIASADNLLYFKSRSDLVTAAKGTPEYNDIFEKLKSISYAQGQEEFEDSDPEDEDQNAMHTSVIPEDCFGEDLVDSDIKGQILKKSKIKSEMEFGASARDLSQPLISKSYKTSDRLKSVRNTTISARSFTLSEQLEFVEKKKL
jgi:hypothetical protein